MPKKIIVDSGYWFALFDERDEHHEKARDLEASIFIHDLLIPWPTLYETLNTRFVQRGSRTTGLAGLRRLFSRPSTVLVEDVPYREAALEFVLHNQRRAYSLVDVIIRSMIEDRSLAIDALISFNPKDFYDVCDHRGIEMLHRE